MLEKPITENEDSLAPPARNKRTGLIVTFAVILALLGLLAWGLRKVQADPLTDGMAPDFTIADFDGRTVTLSELGWQVVIINFWASWCPPCHEETAYLEQTWRKYEGKGVIFIGVDTGRYQDVVNLATKTLDAMSEPVLEESYYWRALARQALGDNRGAIKDLRLSLQYHPGFEPSLTQLEQLKGPP